MDLNWRLVINCLEFEPGGLNAIVMSTNVYFVPSAIEAKTKHF